jgi:RNA polymerase sigma-70 factor (ECF subfamily)
MAKGLRMTALAGEDRFLGLLDEHRKILYKVAASYGRTPEDRRDIEQEIVLQLWRSFGRFDGRVKFSTWMYRIALNVAISFVRRESRRLRRTVTVEGSALDAVPADPRTEEREEGQRLLHHVIHQLDELNRALVILYLDGQSHEEIAEVLGISVSNVGTRMGRIKEQLRRDFGRAEKVETGG